ncbi:hypothetical protein [Streptomyces sp. ODS05-4]|uniref:hypothetical protein n=1 Tax=Streptomyces sp. ODS05-4 TaxID=2944939 RepID=UPI002109A7ED|nr:hypothetical protein [Streptomyces sp. ODS05-4]
METVPTCFCHPDEAAQPVAHRFAAAGLGAVTDVYLGRRPDLTYTRDRAVGTLLLPARRGTVTAVTALPELLRLPGVLRGEVTARVGDRLEPARASNACAGHVHMAGRNSRIVEGRMRAVLGAFRLDVVP